jgi:hypothetical protein
MKWIVEVGATRDLFFDLTAKWHDLLEGGEVFPRLQKTIDFFAGRRVVARAVVGLGASQAVLVVVA